MKISSFSLASVPLAAAFAPPVINNVVPLNKDSLQAEAVSALPSPAKPIFDPLGLYPENSPERAAGLIQPLESLSSREDKEILDPLRLYSNQSQVSARVEMSASLPFLPRPPLLDGTMPGDRGFDPFNFASDANALQWQRTAEIKHARLAMLATAGWPVAELLHKPIATVFDLPSLLASGDRVPSVLNDGLAHAGFPAFWIAAIAAAATIEICESVEENVAWKDGFDPLGLLGGKTEEEKLFVEEAELFNGRLGMLAITGFAIQECFLNSAVVDQMPIFFKPMNVALEQLMNA